MTNQFFDEDDFLDWNFALVGPPPTLDSGDIEVYVEYAGWSAPLVTDEID